MRPDGRYNRGSGECVSSSIENPVVATCTRGSQLREIITPSKLNHLSGPISLLCGSLSKLITVLIECRCYVDDIDDITKGSSRIIVDGASLWVLLQFLCNTAFS